ncbi:scavenger receptor class F member 1-like [Haliotis rubra]|uniref:scavenger receptor class F member 1-like n=1 Tax=Haliotis rubra TaxID=36100 RepID=UPI001EE5CC5D|nr:scavenger receptor class F member 1-like [Haliotis rubra]
MSLLVTCPSGQYGTRCETCGHCENRFCEKTTGVCLRGCAPGYRMPKCREGCNAGTFGVKCQSTCFNCKRGSTCDHVTGRCPTGCIPGWRGDNCTLECPNNTYGACTPCGLCAEDDPCNIGTGHCPRGCKFGWTGPTCKTGWLIFGAAGAVILVIVAVVIGGAVYNVRKLKRRYQNSYVEFAERCNRLYEL